MELQATVLAALFLVGATSGAMFINPIDAMEWTLVLSASAVWSVMMTLILTCPAITQ